MKHLILDWSPIAYGNLFSATTYVQKTKHLNVEKDLGKYNLDQYRDIVIQKIIEEISSLRNKFDLEQSDEIIIATDTSTSKGYWRKDVWEGYKYKRKEARDKSNIQWDKAFCLFQEILETLRECSSLNVVSIPRTEADDIIFILSEYIPKQLDGEVIIYSSDHDFMQCVNNNVKFWRTTRSHGMENSTWYNAAEDEIKDIINSHVIGGDLGDGFGNIKHYSRFSKEFLKIYPGLTGKELQVYPKRFVLEQMFKKKYGEDAEVYNHPRYGYKMFKNSKKSLKSVLKENKIFHMNFKMNKKLALPSGIPNNIKTDIITNYLDNSKKNTSDYMCLSDFMINNNLFELTSQIPFL